MPKKIANIEFVAVPAKRPLELFLQIGHKRYQVASIAEAREMFVAARDKALTTIPGFGASKMPEAKITAADGFFLYGIAYNGRVWELGRDGSQVFLDGEKRDAEWCKQFAVGADNRVEA